MDEKKDFEINKDGDIEFPDGEQIDIQDVMDGEISDDLIKGKTA